MVIPFQDLESLADAAMMMEHKRQSASDNCKWKMMLQGGPRAPRTHNSPYARPPPPNRAPAFAPRPNNNFAPRPNYSHNRPPYYPRNGGNYGGNNFGSNNGNPNGNNFNRAAKLNPHPKPSGGYFACGKEGHFARECPTKAAVPAQPNATKMSHGLPMKKQG